MSVAAIHERRREVRKLAARIWRRSFVTQVGVATTVAAPAVLGTVRPYVQEAVFGDVARSFAVAFASVLAVGALWLWFFNLRGNTARLTWYIDDRRPLPEELRKLGGVRRRIAIPGSFGWATAWLATSVALSRVDGFSWEPWLVAKLFACFATGYAMSTSLNYVLVERELRPYLGRMLSYDTSTWPPALGLAARLALTWVGVAGAPMLLIAFTSMGLTAEQRGLAATPLRFTATAMAVAGLLAFAVIGRSFAEPLRNLRDAHGRIATGDLAARVPIDDPAELGRLEAGFNQMAGRLAAFDAENRELQAALRARLDEVQASRVRIVEAADAERVRIERNLHDGAQQRLLSLALGLRSAQRRLNDPELDRVAGELDAAMAELRELARGIHPAILEEEGLGPALGSLAERAAVPTDVRASLNGRLPRPVEVTAYFVVAEALTNVARYADATRATVEATVTDHTLRVAVSDDGKGGADATQGSGLRGLADRVAALGGELAVQSTAETGTRIEAVIPCR